MKTMDVSRLTESGFSCSLSVRADEESFVSLTIWGMLANPLTEAQIPVVRVCVIAGAAGELAKCMSGV